MFRDVNRFIPHGITLSYPLAHWAKRQALESLYGDFSASFSAIH
jgi:hypothetical protein